MSKEIEISASSAIVAECKEYKGQKAVDLRKHVKSNKYTGPTKQGLWIPVGKWDEFKALVNSIEV